MNNNNLAIVFPGQASQQIGMLKDLALRYSLIEETFAEVSEILKYDMWKLIQYGPIEELNKTFQAQPAILTASVAIWRVWKSHGGCMPVIMAGHSIGEYSALVCAGSMELSAAVRLVKIRGILMQEAAPYGYGAMSVIVGLDKNVICNFCNKIAQQGQVVAPACFNSVKNIVIAGTKEAVYRVNYLCKCAGAKFVSVLPISVPSHCVLMKPITVSFKEALAKIIIHMPNISVINNTDVRIRNNPNAIRDALVRQLYTPVRWNEIIQYFIHQNIKIIIEMGPGRILTNLIRHTVPDNTICSLSINDPISLLKAININVSK